MLGVDSRAVRCLYERPPAVVHCTDEHAQREHVAAGRGVGRRLQLDLRRHVVHVRLRHLVVFGRPRHHGVRVLLSARMSDTVSYAKHFNSSITFCN